MSIHKLAVIVKNPSNEDEFILLQQAPPPKFGDEEYDSYVDSDLWDLPSVQLNSLEGDSQGGIVVHGVDSCLEKVDLSKLDISSGLDQVVKQVGFSTNECEDWKFWKYVEEPEFGPRPLVNIVYVIGRLRPECTRLEEPSKWMTIQSCMDLLLEVKASSIRVGPLVVLGLMNESKQSARLKFPATLRNQEYPPGVNLIPMGSRTAKPFTTTNLIVFAPESTPRNHVDGRYTAVGDALIVDPGCRSKHHKELKEIVDALPRKLVVFVTHHHHDHVDGLSVIQKCNPDAILVAHENTMRRIGKGDWSLGYTAVTGNEEFYIGGQRLKAVFAPGHTDGHMALLHVNSHSLIVGDHCVGQGSALLDISAGGNMSDYFKTTYNFLELSPHALIPMHGRLNLWPKNMLCKYLKNRRSREAVILEAIENGAETLFEIVSTTYADVDRILWIPASSNVRLHVEHLAQLNKLPQGFSLDSFNRSRAAFPGMAFSIQKFQRSCWLNFYSRWLVAFLISYFRKKFLKVCTARVIIAVAVVGFAGLYSVRKSQQV